MADWLEIAVAVDGELVDVVAAVFGDTVVIEDPVVIGRYAAQTHPDEWGIPEQAYAGKLPVVKAYLPMDELSEARFGHIYQVLSGLGLDVDSRLKTRKVRDEDWSTAWRAYYKPVRVGSRLVIKPSWEEWPAAGGDLVVEMDPGMAFGCGTHATTALCLELMEKYLHTGDVVIDVGAGSGILAVSAAMLGAAEVLATDIDATACRVATDNVRLNRVEDRVRVVRGNLLEQAGNKKAHLIVANIIADVIVVLTPDVRQLLLPGGIFIASGIIRERLDRVKSAFKENGLALREQRTEGHWVALVGEMT